MGTIFAGPVRHTEALEGQRRAGFLHGRGVVLNNVADAYLGLGQVTDAIRCLREAQEIFSETRDDRGQGNVLQLLGDAYLQESHIKEGLDCPQRAVEILHATRDRPGEAQALFRLGRAYIQGDLQDEARRHLTGAHAIFRELGDDAQAAAAWKEYAMIPPSGENM